MTALDSRSWLVWGVACMVPLLVSRHPVLVITVLVIVLSVRSVAVVPSAGQWRWIVRVAALFALVGVVFNALTVRTGEQVWFHIPALHWPVTWNAIAYGLVSGVAMVTLVLVGVTVAAGLDWIALTRVLPQRFAPLAASGSVAWSFLPGASQALTDIREAQAARGHALRSGRDLLPIVVPLLDTSLGRALTMSESLEARGFGAASATVPARRAMSLWLALTLGGSLVAVYALALGDTPIIALAAAVVAIGAVGLIRQGDNGPRTTRYRQHRLGRGDWVVMAAAVASLLAFLALFLAAPEAVAFNPYPRLHLPAPDYRMVLAFAPLLAPALYPADGGEP